MTRAFSSAWKWLLTTERRDNKPYKRYRWSAAAHLYLFLRSHAAGGTFPCNNAKRGQISASKLIAFRILAVGGSATYIVLYLCYLAIPQNYMGRFPSRRR